MLQPLRAFSQPPGRCNGSDPDCASGTLQIPRLNQLLAALPPEDCLRLRPRLEPVFLPAGSVIHRAGDADRHLYFLVSGIVSRFYTMANGATAEFAVTGREGVVGVSLFLGGGGTPVEAVVLSPARAYRLQSDALRTEFAENGPLEHLLLRYTMALIVQTCQTAVCNRHHSVDQALCRLLLNWLDRMPSNELTITHDLIGRALGVRRESISQTVGRLKNSGLIRSQRGHIEVLDREGLEAAACECYKVVKDEYDRLLPDELMVRHGACEKRMAA